MGFLSRARHLLIKLKENLRREFEFPLPPSINPSCDDYNQRL